LDEDRDLALSIQEQEYRAHVRGMLGMLAHDQDDVDDVDVDNMTYEELQSLGESLGKVQVAVSATGLEQLDTMHHAEAKEHHRCGEAACSVCQQDYAPDDNVVRLPCKHWFHKTCVFQWLQSSKMCPVCMREVEE
jgi:E3 ubiquitin-protein ligase BIG BROTHER and related proteins